MTRLAIRSFPKRYGTFVVSTANRSCSAAIAYGAQYAETIVFYYAHDHKDIGKIVWQGEASEGSLFRHNQVCEWLDRNPSMDGFEDA